MARSWLVRLAGGLALVLYLAMATAGQRSAFSASASNPNGAIQPRASIPDSMPAPTTLTALPPGLPSSIPLRRDPPMLAESSNVLSWLGMLGSIVLGAGVYGLYLRRAARNVNAKQAQVLEGRGRQGNWGPWKLWFKGPLGAELQVVASTRLTPGHSVHVLQWQGQTFLLGCSAESITVLEKHVAPKGDSLQQGTAP